jgi:enamine deaminase RidA (YjgF/YER057c/UK114 family)
MPTDEGTAAKSFRGADGGAEHFISVQAPAGLEFADQLDLLEQRYAQAQRSFGLSPDCAVFRRIFVSDAMNQAVRVRQSPLCAQPSDNPVAISIIQQPPLPDAKLALLAYHIESTTPIVKRRLSSRHLLIERGGASHLWSTRLCAGTDSESPSAAEQTLDVFGDLIDTLDRQGGNLRDNCVRTWIYLKDVDVFYQDMVASRRDLFQQQGLTADTHYIASTGIEGACAHRYDLIQLDAYSILGLLPGQMTYLNDFSRLCPTKDYNVTFERGTRIGYADRSHHFISGTASIDERGRVLHPGDVMRQLERALGNVDALLHSGGAGIDEMMHLVVYLRDRADFARVDGYLKERFADLPTLVVQGPVCRPEWLIEVEGIAIATNNEPAFPEF